MKPAEDIKRLVNKLNDTTSAEMDERVLTDVLEALAESKKPSALTRPKMGRILMKSPITKLAAVVVIIVVVLIGINQFEVSTTGVAWGEVVRNVQSSPGFIYRMRQTRIVKETGTEYKLNMKVYGSSEYGMRMDAYINPEDSNQTCVSLTYASLKEETLISILHASKAYTRQPLTSEQMAELERFDPKECFRRLLSVGYKKLGRKSIDGVEAEGVEITNPAGACISSEVPIEVDSLVAQLWVAVETGLPIFFESKTICNNGTKEFHTIQDEYQWNVELDADEFEPNIPADYTLIEN